jgi:hypothetical protein
MRSASTAYDVTRRDGQRVVITRETDVTSDPKTGIKTPVNETTNVRWAVVESTQYRRFLRADATKQTIGSTTVIMWTKDVAFTFLDDNAFITVTDGGQRLDVVAAWIEEDSFIATCEEYKK